MKFHDPKCGSRNCQKEPNSYTKSWHVQETILQHGVRCRYDSRRGTHNIEEAELHNINEY
jgi:hypothetical protein